MWMSYGQVTILLYNTYKTKRGTVYLNPLNVDSLSLGRRGLRTVRTRDFLGDSKTGRVWRDGLPREVWVTSQPIVEGYRNSEADRSTGPPTGPECRRVNITSPVLLAPIWWRHTRASFIANISPLEAWREDILHTRLTLGSDQLINPGGGGVGDKKVLIPISTEKNN